MKRGIQMPTLLVSPRGGGGGGLVCRFHAQPHSRLTATKRQQDSKSFADFGQEMRNEINLKALKNSQATGHLEATTEATNNSRAYTKHCHKRNLRLGNFINVPQKYVKVKREMKQISVIKDTKFEIVCSFLLALKITVICGRQRGVGEVRPAIVLDCLSYLLKFSGDGHNLAWQLLMNAI